MSAHKVGLPLPAVNPPNVRFVYSILGPAVTRAIATAERARTPWPVIRTLLRLRQRIALARCRELETSAPTVTYRAAGRAPA